MRYKDTTYFLESNFILKKYLFILLLRSSRNVRIFRQIKRRRSGGYLETGGEEIRGTLEASEGPLSGT